MIKSFKNREMEQIFNRKVAKRYPPDMQRIAFRKLRMLNRSINLQDLTVPPANHIEALKGDRKGQHRIRINDKWRICFIW